MITTHPIRFVSLGPGEPDLITLKGLKALQGADFTALSHCGAPDGSALAGLLSDLSRSGAMDGCFSLSLGVALSHYWLYRF